MRSFARPRTEAEGSSPRKDPRDNLFRKLLGLAQPSNAVPYPVVKQGQNNEHFVQVCIHESPSSNGYIGKCVKANDDITANDIKLGILEAIQIWNRYGLADVELYYSGSCTSGWPADDVSGVGTKTAVLDQNDPDGTNEIGCSLDIDSEGYNGYVSYHAGGDGDRDCDQINEFALWLNPKKNFTRNLTNYPAGETVIETVMMHEFGHTFGLRHIHGGGNGTCDDASIMCTNRTQDLFLLYSDVNVMVNDSVGESCDAEGWNNEHRVGVWTQADSPGAGWSTPMPWGFLGEFSVLPPAIAASPTTANYMVGWVRPSDEAHLRTAIGDGSFLTWTSTTGHGYASSYHSFAIAGDEYGKWVVAWRERGTATDTNRDILIRAYGNGAWSTPPKIIEYRVDAWGSPTLAYDPATNRFVLGWVHSKVSDSLSVLRRWPRFKTFGLINSIPPAPYDFSPVVEIFADNNQDGVPQLSEHMVPWDSFDIDCDDVDCQVVYVESDANRSLWSFRVDVSPGGIVTYVDDSREIVSGGTFQGGTAVAIDAEHDRRAMALRATTQYGEYGYPVFDGFHKDAPPPTYYFWSPEVFVPDRESSAHGGFTYNPTRAEWMMVDLEGE